MLLQMRQCCDHPHLVLSRADTTSDLGKIGKQLLRRWREMQQGEGGEGAAAAVSQGRFLEDTLLRLKRQAGYLTYISPVSPLHLPYISRPPAPPRSR